MGTTYKHVIPDDEPILRNAWIAERVFGWKFEVGPSGDYLTKIIDETGHELPDARGGRVPDYKGDLNAAHLMEMKLDSFGFKQAYARELAKLLKIDQLNSRASQDFEIATATAHQRVQATYNLMTSLQDWKVTRNG